MTSDEVLRDFVAHSNALEDITLPPFGPGTPEFDWHLDAARWVASTGSADFMAIRSRLEGGQSVSIRTNDGDDVMVNAHVAPSPGAALRAALQDLDRALAHRPLVQDAAVHAMRTHDLLVLAHPFADGNGRTARLLANAVRIEHGLLWLIFDVRERRAYHRRLDDLAAAIWRRVDMDDD